MKIHRIGNNSYPMQKYKLDFKIFLELFFFSGKPKMLFFFYHFCTLISISLVFSTSKFWL